MEIGLWPINEINGKANFIFQALLFGNRTFLRLNEDELANLFLFLRREKKFSNVDGSYTYADKIAENFHGTFSIEKMGFGMIVIYYMNDEGIVSTAGPLHVNDIKKLLKNEEAINNQIIKIGVEKEHTIEQLDTVVRECDGNAGTIQNLAKTKLSAFYLEMAANHFSFFEKHVNFTNSY